MASYQWPAPPSAGTVTIAAVGANGATAPTSSIEIGVIDGSGNLAAVTQGSALSAASIPVVIASDQAAVSSKQSGTWNITNVSGTVSLPTGAATETTLSTLNGKVTACNTGAVVVSSSALPSGAATAAKQPALGTAGVASTDVLTIQGIASMVALLMDQTKVNGTTIASGNGTASAGCARVTIASDNTAFTVNSAQSGTWTVQPGNTANTTAWLVKEETSGTATTSSVAGSATTAQLLAANTARKMATFFNDSTATLYLKLGTTASTTDYTVQILSNGYYELPAKYTGRIDGIWASATGSARITELT